MYFSKKLKFFLLFIIVWICSCKNQAAKHFLYLTDYSNGLSCEGFNGNVKQAITEGLGLNKDYYQEITLNEKGDLTYSEERYLEVTDSEISTDSTNISRKIKYETIRNNKGEIITIVGNYQNGMHYQEKWELDGKRRLISSQFQRYKYDANDDLVEFRWRYDDMSDPDLYKYKYDNNHNLVESMLYDPGTNSSDELLVKSEIEYPTRDANNNWTSRITHKSFYGPLSYLNKRDDTVSRKIIYY